MKRAMVVLLGMGLLGSTAWADGIVLSGPMVVSGNGFGNDARALTVQSHGPSATTESGCVAPGLTVGGGACAAGDGVYGGNEVSPNGFPKQSAPTLSSLGITSGSQVGILFDAVQPQNGKNSLVTINDLTLKLYSGSTLLFTTSGSFANLATNPGNGQSDYLFTLDPSAVSGFNAAFAGNGSDTIALDAMLSFARQSGGPDSFSFVSLASTTPTPMSATPEPSSLLLLGTGLAGAAGLLRRRMLRG